MSPSGAHLQLILPEAKFQSRLLSKEASASASAPSFRVYYGVASGSVPFVWESQPGTPKHAMADHSLPPLTPPPSSYCYASASSKSSQSVFQKHTATLFHSLLPRLRKPGGGSHRRAHSSGTASSFSSNSRPDDDDDDCGGGRLSPTSTLCFGLKRTLLSVRRNGI